MGIDSLFRAFLQFAPKLGGLITILGVVIFLFFSVIRTLIGSKKLRVITEGESGRVLHKALDYSFWLAIVVVVLGFWVLMLPKLFPDPRYAFWFSVVVILTAAFVVFRLPGWLSRGQLKPKLALSFADRAQVRRLFGKTPLGRPGIQTPPPRLGKSDENGFSSIDLTSPCEVFVCEVGTPRTFNDMSPDPDQERQEWTGDHGLVLCPFVVNLGSGAAKNVWFKLHITSSLSLFTTLPPTMDIAVDEITGNSIIELTESGIHLPSRVSYNPHAILSFHFPEIAETYSLRYEVGSDNSDTIERQLTIEVRTHKVPECFIENARGLRAAQQQKAFEAIQHFRNAVSLDSSVAAFHFNLANMLNLRRGDGPPSDETVLSAQRAAELAPSEARVSDFLGLVLTAAGKLEDATNVCLMMLDRKWYPHYSKSYLVKSLAAIDTPEARSSAIALLVKVRSIFPNDSLTLSDLGGFYLGCDDLNRAEECLKRAAELDPHDPVTKYNLGLLSKRRKVS